MAIGIPLRSTAWSAGVKQHRPWMGDRSGMSISADNPSDETLNRDPLALLLRRQYEFPVGVNKVHFSIL